MNTSAQMTETKKENPFRQVLGNRNFRLLWIGEGVSVLGDHFTMIALPWLVLQLTGDSLAMGSVLALAASRLDVTGLLIVSGSIVLTIGLLMTLNPTVRAMEPATQAGDLS